MSPYRVGGTRAAPQSRRGARQRLLGVEQGAVVGFVRGLCLPEESRQPGLGPGELASSAAWCTGWGWLPWAPLCEQARLGALPAPNTCDAVEMLPKSPSGCSVSEWDKKT